MRSSAPLHATSRRPTDQASAALKGVTECAGPEKVNAKLAEPFNVRLHAVVGRLLDRTPKSSRRAAIRGSLPSLKKEDHDSDTEKAADHEYSAFMNSWVLRESQRDDEP